MISLFFRHRLTWLAVLVSLGIGVLCAQTMWKMREDQWAYHQRTNANLTSTLAKGLEWSLDAVDLTLQKTAIALQDAQALQTSEYLSHSVLLDAIWADMAISGITVLDTQGRVIERNQGSMRQGLDLSKKDFFQAFAKGGHRDIFIGAPTQDWMHGAQVLPLARRWHGRDGSWQGVVVGRLHMHEINAWLSSMQLGEFSGVNVIRQDGLILTRFPYQESTAARTIAGSDNLARFVASPQGSFVGVAVLDGVERLYTHHRVGYYPMVVNSAQATYSIVKEWWRSALKIGIFALFLMLGCIGLALLFTRELGRREATEEDLFAEKERMRLTLQSIGDAVVCADAQGRITYLNPVAQQMTGLSADRAVGEPVEVLRNILVDVDKQSAALPLRQVLERGAVVERHRAAVMHCSSGQQIEIEETVSPVLTAHGAVVGAVAVLRDVTLAAAQEARMQHLAFHDPLTGLPNRLLLQDRALQAMADAERHGQGLAVVYLDLDGFKPINDKLGHQAGDVALMQVAQSLLGCVRASDTVCRLGGDEFVLLLTHTLHETQLRSMAEKIMRACMQPFVWEGQTHYLSASGGVSLFPQHGQQWETLLQCADSAMYVAKKEGRHQIHLYRGDGVTTLLAHLEVPPNPSAL